jgi:hypothetical protein
MTGYAKVIFIDRWARFKKSERTYVLACKKGVKALTARLDSAFPRAVRRGGKAQK